MPISVIALVLNIAAGIGVWSGGWSLLNKIVLTVLLAGKYALFFWSVWMAEERGRRNSVVACFVANLAIAVYAYFSAEVVVALIVAAMQLLLAIWTSAVVCEKRSTKVFVVFSAAVFFAAMLLGVIFFDLIREAVRELLWPPINPVLPPGYSLR